jgi:hypothetical protein
MKITQRLVAPLAACLLITTSCATPKQKAEAPSPCTVTTLNSVYVGFFVSIEPIQGEAIAAVELWYANKYRSTGQILEQTGDTVKVRFRWYAKVFTQDYLDVHVVTKNGEIHKFHIESPTENTQKKFKGTIEKLW